MGAPGRRKMKELCECDGACNTSLREEHDGVRFTNPVSTPFGKQKCSICIVLMLRCVSAATRTRSYRVLVGH